MQINRKKIFEFSTIAIIIIAAMLIRAKVMFGTSLVPGMNGAYYLVQVRSIIEKGVLGEPDMPLVFYLQAGFALLIKLFSRLSLENSIFLAIKLFDVLIPPLSVIPAYLISNYLDKEKHPIISFLAIASVVAFSYGPLRMIGDFQKNSLGMLWFLFMAYFIIRAFSEKNKKYLSLALVFLTLTGLTHIGAFGVALIFAVLSLIFWAIFVAQKSKQTLIVIGTSIGAIVAILALLSLISDSSRISKLIALIKEPLKIFSFSNARFLFRAENLQSTIIFLVICAVAIAAFILKRHSIEKWELSIFIPALITTLSLISPFVSQDYSTRFQIMAFIPGAIVLAFLLRHSGTLFKTAAVAVVVAAVAISIPQSMAAVQSPSISQAEYEELTTLKQYVDASSETLIVARHGLEWWVSWVLHTNIAQPKAVQASDWTTYKTVLYLQEQGMGGFGPIQIGTPPTDQSSQDRVNPPQGFNPNTSNATPPQNFNSNRGTFSPPQGNFPSDGTFNDAISLTNGTTIFKGTYLTLIKLEEPATSTTSGGN